MSGVFATFGEGIRSSLTNFAEAASGQIASEIAIVVYTGVLLYFMIRAYLLMTGRIEGAIPDLVTQCAKIVLIAFFALNAGNFATYVIPAVYGVENMLLGALSTAAGLADLNNCWSIVDMTWESFMKGVSAIQNIWSKLSWGVFGDSMALIAFVLAMLVLIFFVSIYFMFFAVGYLMLYEIFLVMGLSFGPLFICTLMFPATRSWFDGWLRAIICWVFTLVAIAGMLCLLDGIFTTNIDELTLAAEEAQAAKNFSTLSLKLATFSVIVLAVATVVKSIPSFASGITGGVALQAASVAGMFSSVGRTMAAATGGAILGYGAATHNDELREKARNILGSGGLTNTGSFASAAMGYSLGSAARLFGFDHANGETNGATTAPPSQQQTPQEEAQAARNAASVGVPGAFGESSAPSAGASGSQSASGPAGAPGTAGSTGEAGATGASGAAGSTGTQGAAGAAGVSGVSSAMDKDSNFSTDHSQFDYKSDFSASEHKATEAEVPQSASGTSTSQSVPTEAEQMEQQQEIRAQANEKAAAEILKKRNGEQ
ncbi:type IV secretion system protein [Parasutterella muris]|uniref:type IV secretion system protein n=1 Tax=Parasutterella muris TaxID=2565572 RepID=UPI0020423C97|nr:type IV secretion system protein [Parasutterella muris]